MWNGEERIRHQRAYGFLEIQCWGIDASHDAMLTGAATTTTLKLLMLQFSFISFAINLAV